MNVASLDLCKELYELSGWRDSGIWFGLDANSHTPSFVTVENQLHVPYDFSFNTPAYDLGFLLDKICTFSELSKLSILHLLEKFIDDDEEWADAVAKLAIELFKQKVLTREHRDE